MRVLLGVLSVLTFEQLTLAVSIGIGVDSNNSGLKSFPIQTNEDSLNGGIETVLVAK